MASGCTPADGDISQHEHIAHNISPIQHGTDGRDDARGDGHGSDVPDGFGHRPDPRKPSAGSPRAEPTGPGRRRRADRNREVGKFAPLTATRLRTMSHSTPSPRRRSAARSNVLFFGPRSCAPYAWAIGKPESRSRRMSERVSGVSLSGTFPGFP